MKQLIFIFLLTILLISCNTNEKYQGKWRLDIFKSSSNELEHPFSITIKKDSIQFDYSSFTHSHKYPLIIENNKLIFNNWTINSILTKDTLSFKSSFYVKDNNDSILNWWKGKPIIKIELPQANSKYFNSLKNPTETRKRVILYGKRIDNNKFSLQLNDKYASTRDLIPFLEPGHTALREELSPFFTTFLLLDKKAEMKEIEKILTTMSRIGCQRIKLINNINLYWNNSTGLYYNYESTIKKLPIQHINEKYYISIINEILPPPPPPPFKYSLFGDFHSVHKFLLLKKDKIYYNNRIISPSQLKPLLKPWIKDNNVIFSLYDLESTYGPFLEMNAIINSAYTEIREKQAKMLYNKELENLARDELTEIKLQNPMFHVWSYSIPHYNTIVKKENSFFGVKVNCKM